MSKFSSAAVDLNDNSVDTFMCNKEADDIKKCVISSKDKSSFAASIKEGQRNEIVVEGSDIEIREGKIDVGKKSVRKIAGESVHCDKSLMATNIKEEKTLAEIRGKAEGIVLDGTPVGHVQQLEGITKSGAAKINEDFVESSSTLVIVPNQLGSAEVKAARSKKVAKRISPEKDDQDDNTPIKLLRRAIKIEKIG